MNTYAAEVKPGYQVRDANDDVLGTVDRIDNGTIYVEPHDDISSLARLVLRWPADGDTHRLRDQHIDYIGDGHLYLKSNL